MIFFCTFFHVSQSSAVTWERGNVGPMLSHSTLPSPTCPWWGLPLSPIVDTALCCVQVVCVLVFVIWRFYVCVICCFILLVIVWVMFQLNTVHWYPYVAVHYCNVMFTCSKLFITPQHTYCSLILLCLCRRAITSLFTKPN